MGGIGSGPLGRVVSRRAANAITDALADTRVVVVNGARQCGKSTLIRIIAGSRTAEWRDLDAQLTREAAQRDPTGSSTSAT